jgi:hypothetical protein
MVFTLASIALLNRHFLLISRNKVRFKKYTKTSKNITITFFAKSNPASRSEEQVDVNKLHLKIRLYSKA